MTPVGTEHFQVPEQWGEEHSQALEKRTRWM